MGATDVKQNQSKSGKTPGTETGTDNGHKVSGIKSTENSNPVKRRSSGRGEQQAGETEKKKESPRLVDLVLPDGEVKKPKRKYTKKKQEQSYTVDSEQIKILLLTVSSIIASRENFEQWQLSDSECESIAIPLMNIVKKSDVFSKITEKSDAIALAIALSTAFVPRVMITVDKIKKGKKKNGNKLNRQTTESANSNGGTETSNTATTQSGINNETILGSIPEFAESF